MKNCRIARTSSVFLLAIVTVFSGSWVAAGESEEPPRIWFSSQIQGHPQGELAKPGENLSLFTSSHINPAGRSIDNSGNASSDQAWEDRLYFAQAQKEPPTEPEKGGGMTMEEIARAMDNPLGNLWMLIVQNDLSLFKSDLIDTDGELFNSLKLMPVLPIRLTENWNLINRPILQLQSSPLDSEVGQLFGIGAGQITANPGLAAIAQNPIGRTTGFGDIIMFNMISPRAANEGFIWGVGPTFIFPTASHDVLGQGKWQIGPSALAANLGKEWNIGALVQQWYSYAGDDDRADTSQMDIQYFANYHWDPLTLVGMTPNIRINWKAEKDEQISFPVGLGIIRTTKWGKLPIRWGVEFQYYVIRPDAAGPQFNLKMFIIPVVPPAEFARSPLF